MVVTYWVGIASLRARGCALQLTVGIAIGLARAVGGAIVAGLSGIDVAVSTPWWLGVAPLAIGGAVASGLAVLPTIVAVLSPVSRQVLIQKCA